MRFLLVIGLLLVCAGCSRPFAEDPETLEKDAQEVVFTTDRRSYAPGITLFRKLENKGSDPFYYYSECVELEQEQGATFVRIEGYDLCSTGISIIDPGAHERFGVLIDEDWEAGTYRYSTKVYLQLDRQQEQQVYTDIFTIVR